MPSLTVEALLFIAVIAFRLTRKTFLLLIVKPNHAVQAGQTTVVLIPTVDAVRKSLQTGETLVVLQIIVNLADLAFIFAFHFEAVFNGILQTPRFVCRELEVLRTYSARIAVVAMIAVIRTL